MPQLLIKDRRILTGLAKAGLIIWPIIVDNSKKIPFKYVDSVDDNHLFTHKGRKYHLKYHDGCFYPYVYLIY